MVFDNDWRFVKLLESQSLEASHLLFFKYLLETFKIQRFPHL